MPPEEDEDVEQQQQLQNQQQSLQTQVMQNFSSIKRAIENLKNFAAQQNVFQNDIFKLHEKQEELNEIAIVQGTLMDEISQYDQETEAEIERLCQIIRNNRKKSKLRKIKFLSALVSGICFVTFVGAQFVL